MEMGSIRTVGAECTKMTDPSMSATFKTARHKAKAPTSILRVWSIAVISIITLHKEREEWSHRVSPTKDISSRTCFRARARKRQKATNLRESITKEIKREGYSNGPTKTGRTISTTATSISKTNSTAKVPLMKSRHLERSQRHLLWLFPRRPQGRQRHLQIQNWLAIRGRLLEGC